MERLLLLYLLLLPNGIGRRPYFSGCGSVLFIRSSFLLQCIFFGDGQLRSARKSHGEAADFLHMRGVD
nr:hypothetical protein [uncultured Phascolarctobacterium sp.]